MLKVSVPPFKVKVFWAIDLDGVNAQVGGAGKSDGVGKFGGKGRGIGGRNVADIERAAGDVERFADVELADVLRAGR